ncbi:TatD family hydrolase [soil metagenome]
MPYIDTHAHIYAKEFESDINKVLEKSREVPISKIYMPNIDHTSIDRMMELEEKNRDLCLSMMGLHPCSVKKDFEKELYQVEEWLSKRKFAAIGETGIDLYWDKTFIRQQEEALKIQIDLAKKYKIPIVLHCRDSFEETIDIIEKHKDDDLKGIFHCFTGSLDEANRVINSGFYLGIGGVVTFKNGGLDKVLPDLDLSNIVLETDSPYLAPVPYRGKRNEPAYLESIAVKIAELKKIEIEEVMEATTFNAQKIFTI